MTKWAEIWALKQKIPLCFSREKKKKKSKERIDLLFFSQSLVFSTENMQFFRSSRNPYSINSISLFSPFQISVLDLRLIQLHWLIPGTRLPINHHLTTCSLPFFSASFSPFFTFTTISRFSPLFHAFLFLFSLIFLFCLFPSFTSLVSSPPSFLSPCSWYCSFSFPSHLLRQLHVTLQQLKWSSRHPFLTRFKADVIMLKKII